MKAKNTGSLTKGFKTLNRTALACIKLPPIRLMLRKLSNKYQPAITLTLRPRRLVMPTEVGIPAIRETHYDDRVMLHR
jgi:hypothetical protein